MPPKKAALLPAKERSLFARLIQEYESKKYKLGLKTADAILKKFPEHGETLCMKGLILGMMERRAEGIELAKRGVRLDIASFIAWHALGILNRQDHNYAEAIKCYQQAIRIEGGTNVNLLRETTYLYIQERMYQPLIEQRLHLLKVQPHVRWNWIGLAVSHHLAGSREQTLRVLTGLEATIRDVPEANYEYSEILLYHASVLLELARHKDVLEYLDAQPQKRILDVKAANVMRAHAKLALGETESARELFESLLRRNEEERAYIVGWLRAEGIEAAPKDEAGQQAAIAAFSKLHQLYPKSSAARRLALAYLHGDAFRKQAEDYVTKALRKGVPSIFGDLQSLYRDEKKAKVLEGVVESLRAKWISEAEGEPPSSYLWALYYLAQHYSWMRNHSRALEYIEAAIAHSPALPDLHMMHARLLKRAGALLAAAHAMQQARILDGQDRFVNCKAAKYQLRIDCTTEATRLVSLFTKPDAPDPVFDLVEMQAFWYLAEEAESWARQGKLALAFKRLNQIDKVFTDIYQDQLDFHSYSLRKFTLRSYVETVRFEDGLRMRPVHLRAALLAVRLCLRLHDEPQLRKGPPAAQSNNGAELTEEQRKEAKKAKKAELKAQEEARKKQAKQPKPEVKKVDDEDIYPPPKDEDPEGTKFLAEVDALAEAQRWLRLLHANADSHVETWLATFEFARRKQNWLLAAQAVSKGLAIDGNRPELHPLAVLLHKEAPTASASEPEPVKAAIDAVLAQSKAAASTSDYLQHHPDSAAHVVAAARALGHLGRADEATALLLQTAQRAELRASLDDLVEARDWLAAAAGPPGGPTSATHADAGRLEEFRRAAAAARPYADAFKTRQQLEQEEACRCDEDAAWAASREPEEAA